MNLFKGYCSLFDALEGVGRRKYGDAWVDLETRKQIRQKIPSNAEERRAKEERISEIVRRRSDVARLMQREFQGSPPHFSDGVPLDLKTDSDWYPLPPKLWLDDERWQKMFDTGKAEFHPARYPLPGDLSLWSPTAAPLSGDILISNAHLNRLIEQIAPANGDTPPQVDQGSPVQLGNASHQAIDDTIHSVYDEAEAREEKPPNLKEVAGLVQSKLKEQGKRASQRQIREIADAPKHARRRGSVGVRVTRNNSN